MQEPSLQGEPGNTVCGGSTNPNPASTSPTASHSLSTDTNDDDYEWEKYLRLEDGFISSSLTSLDALHGQETSKVLMEQPYRYSMCMCMYLACVHADSYVMPSCFTSSTGALLALIYLLLHATRRRLRSFLDR